MRMMYESQRQRGNLYLRQGSKKGKGDRVPKNQLLSTDDTSQNQLGRKLINPK